MAQSHNKRELEKNRRKKQKEKRERRAERKLQREDDGKKSFDDMIMYVDEDGNLSSTPPDPTKKKKEIELESIQLGAAERIEEDVNAVHSGTVKFFNDEKGYGFITDKETKESVFVHANNLNFEIKEGNFVEFKVELGPKGYVAIDVVLK